MLKMNNYELRVAVVDLDLLEQWNNEFNDNKEVTEDTHDNEFYAIAEEQGNVYSIGGFERQLNRGEIGKDTNKVIVRFLLCDVEQSEDETRQDIISLENSILTIQDGTIEMSLEMY